MHAARFKPTTMSETYTTPMVDLPNFTVIYRQVFLTFHILTLECVMNVPLKAAKKWMRYHILRRCN